MDRVHEFVPVFSEAAASVAIILVALFWARDVTSTPRLRFGHRGIWNVVGGLVYQMMRKYITRSRSCWERGQWFRKGRFSALRRTIIRIQDFR